MKTHKLTPEERAALQILVNEVTAAKLEAYNAKAALGLAGTKVATAVRAVELAEARFNAGVGVIGNSCGIAGGQISPDLTLIEEQQ